MSCTGAALCRRLPSATREQQMLWPSTCSCCCDQARVDTCCGMHREQGKSLHPEMDVCSPVPAQPQGRCRNAQAPTTSAWSCVQGNALLLRASQKTPLYNAATSLGHASEHEPCCSIISQLAFLCAGDALLIRAASLCSTAGLGQPGMPSCSG